MGNTTQRDTKKMGRRKIDIAYINDDRVRKVTFCKRKGGLFKKAEDLSKLCGVEIAVVIVADNKTSEFASTDIERIMTRYKELQAGSGEESSETSRLWDQLERQRRELEALTRELTEERRKVEELRTSGMMPTVTRPMEVAETIRPQSLPCVQSELAVAPMSMQHVSLPTLPGAALLLPTSMQLENRSQIMMSSTPKPGDREDGNASDDTAEVEDVVSEGEEIAEEPEAKRLRMSDSKAPDLMNNNERVLFAAVAEATLCAAAVEC